MIVQAKTRDDAKSKDSSDDSGDSEDSDNERATIQAELDEDPMEEVDMITSPFSAHVFNSTNKTLDAT